MRPDCPKCSTPSDVTRWPRTPPSHDKVAGWPSITVTMPRKGGKRRQQASRYARRVRKPAHARARRRLPAGVQPIRRGDGEDRNVAAVFGEEARGRDRFRRDHALIGDDDLAIGTGRTQPIGAVDDVTRERVVDLALGLFERTRRKAQIDRAASFVAQPALFVVFRCRRAGYNRTPSQQDRRARPRRPARTRQARPAPCRSAAYRSIDARRLPAPASRRTASPPE